MDQLSKDLCSACKAGKVHEAQRLVEEGADVNFRDTGYGNWTPLLHAARMGQCDVISFLVDEAGAALQATDMFGWSAMHYAAKNGHVEAANLLVDKGANYEALNRGNQAPVDVAKSPKYARKIQQHIERNERYFEACRDGGLLQVKYLLEKGVDINARNIDGWTGVCYAFAAGNVKVVNHLLAMGAVLEGKDGSPPPPPPPPPVSASTPPSVRGSGSSLVSDTSRMRSSIAANAFSKSHSVRNLAVSSLTRSNSTRNLNRSMSSRNVKDSSPIPSLTGSVITPNRSDDLRLSMHSCDTLATSLGDSDDDTKLDIITQQMSSLLGKMDTLETAQADLQAAFFHKTGTLEQQMYQLASGFAVMLLVVLLIRPVDGFMSSSTSVMMVGTAVAAGGYYYVQQKKERENEFF